MGSFTEQHQEKFFRLLSYSIDPGEIMLSKNKKYPKMELLKQSYPREGFV